MKVGVVYEVLRWEERALIDALKPMAEVKPVHLESLSLRIDEDGSPGMDIALQRSISHQRALESTLALEGIGITTVNSSKTISISSDKLWTATLLRRSGIPTPVTMVAFGPDAVFKAAEEIGYPLVLKPINGSWGRMVCLARDEEELRAIVEHRRYMQGINSSVFFIQEFVRKPGRDIRVLVVGDDIAAAAYRYSDHWITNAARGGNSVKAEVDDDLRDISLRAAEAVGGGILGIDIFEDPERGYLVNEVNAVPEFKSAARATGCDIPRMMANYVVSVARK